MNNASSLPAGAAYIIRRTVPHIDHEALNGQSMRTMDDYKSLTLLDAAQKQLREARNRGWLTIGKKG